MSVDDDMNTKPVKVQFKRPSLDERFRRYEQEKMTWIRFNPTATPRQYEEAMQAIAKRYGV